MKKKVDAAFGELRQFLLTAARVSEPSDNEVKKLFEPVAKIINEISEFKDSKRTSKQFNHLAAVAEGIPAISWVLVKKTPVPFAKDMLEASMFYINRVLREFKGVNQKHVEWAGSWKSLLETMIQFVQKTHTTGLVWNSSPGSVPPKVTAPPPPPPPPPIANFSFPPPPKTEDSRNALFADLNKGEGVTARLKKVSASEQTHKNPALRGNASFVIKKDEKQVPLTAKPSKLELEDGKRWIIENFTSDRNIAVEVTDKKQAIYVFKCENSVIQVKGKANSITLDNCKKTSIVFDSLVAQCETINCKSIQIQTLGEMPTLSIQKTDGCQVYLSPASLNAEIITSKSSEMNILVPKDGDSTDYVEYPVPEQYKTTYTGGKLVTTAAEII